MRCLLDTDHINILQQRSDPEYGALMAHLAVHPRSDIGFAIVSFHEQVIGCHTYIARAGTSADLVRGYAMLARVISDYGTATILPFDPAALWRSWAPSLTTKAVSCGHFLPEERPEEVVAALRALLG